VAALACISAHAAGHLLLGQGNRVTASDLDGALYSRDGGKIPAWATRTLGLHWSDGNDGCSGDVGGLVLFVGSGGEGCDAQPITDTGALMHAKYMHELCSLLMYITTYYNVISYYNYDLQ
jgi:hypothetical protein